MQTNVEWESFSTRLVRITGLPRGPNFPKGHRTSARYYQMRQRGVEKIFVHQSAGGYRDGIDAPRRIAEWIIRPPRYKTDAEGTVVLRNGRKIWIGGGRGFPGIPYTFVVPTRPAVEDGKLVVYRCWDDEWVTWHTRRFNRIGVGVCFIGNFQTRHSSRSPDQHPTAPAVAAGFDLIENYLLPRYGLDPDDVCGHFDAGKPACPGDALEAKIRRWRGEHVEWFGDDDSDEPKPGQRQLHSEEQRIAALRDLGLGEWWDLETPEGWRLAVEAVQLAGGATVDGVYGPQTERALRKLLSEWT